MATGLNEMGSPQLEKKVCLSSFQATMSNILWFQILRGEDLVVN